MVDVCHTSVPGSMCGFRAFICSRMKPMVCWRIIATWPCSCCTLALASASRACSSLFSTERASRACRGQRSSYRIQRGATHGLGPLQPLLQRALVAVRWHHHALRTRLLGCTQSSLHSSSSYNWGLRFFSLRFEQSTTTWSLQCL